MEGFSPQYVVVILQNHFLMLHETKLDTVMDVLYLCVTGSRPATFESRVATAKTFDS